jgi:DNA topoisomerase-1
VETRPTSPSPPLPIAAARAAGLRYVSTTPLPPGFERRRSGKGFVYTTAEGTVVRDAGQLRRIRSLAIPPAWTDVWICPSPLGHIQALGRDARGRRQYRYHPRWRDVRDETKYGQLVAFGQRLPAIRRRVKADLAKPGMPFEKVLATVVELLDRTMIRVGNEEYAKANGSFGLTTLRGRHVKVARGALEFRFRGKSGKEHRVRVDDRRLARIVKECQDLPGQELFRYIGEDGTPQSIDSADVNAYLRAIAGDDVSAKVFRTWAGTVRALTGMRQRAAEAATSGETSRGPTRSEVLAVIKEVAACLGNTPAVCRKGYIHPAVTEGFERGTLLSAIAALEGRAGARRRVAAGLSADERLALAFLAAAEKKRARAPSLVTALRRSVKRVARARRQPAVARRASQE